MPIREATDQVMLTTRRICALLFTAFLLASPARAQSKLEWTPLLVDALSQAESENRVVFISLGFVGENRSQRIRKTVFNHKAVVAQAKLSLNVPAWNFRPGDRSKLAKFGKAKALDHQQNLTECLNRWLVPNDQEQIAWPQHLWISPAGELLLSCPWELNAEEMSWCFDEAFRRAKIADPPQAAVGAHPPRRLLLGQEALQLPEGETLGRGLLQDELAEIIAQGKKNIAGLVNASDYIHLLFTDSEQAAKAIQQQLGLLQFGGSASSEFSVRALRGIGILATSSFLPLLVSFSENADPSIRSQVAVALEQLGDSEALSILKKRIKKEGDPAVLAEWVRALGACGRGDKTIARSLIKLVDKEKDARVRINAILALGHVLPESNAQKYLIDLAQNTSGKPQLAAVLALGLGRNLASHEVLSRLNKGDPGETLKLHLTAVLEVLDGANLSELETLFQAMDGSPFDRKRLFFRSELDLEQSK
jgi:HEAT repeats